MSILRVGSSGKYADNWDNIFGKKQSKPAATAKKKAAPKKSTKKPRKK